MGIVELLSRLWRAARSRDNKTARELLALARHHGWDRQVAEGVARMPSRDAAFVLETIAAVVAEREYTAPAGQPTRPKPALVGAAASTGIVGVTRDAASGYYFPASSAEWTTFLAAIGSSVAVPTSVYLCQEASGNLADSVGSFTMTAAGAPSYQQSETGFTRKAVVIASDSAGTFTTSSASLPAPNTGNMLALMIARPIASPGGLSTLFWSDGATFTGTKCTAAGKFQAYCNNGVNNATGSNTVTGAVRPLAFRSVPSSSSIVGFTDTEKLTPTYATPGTTKVFALNGGPVSALYIARWDGANGNVSDANLKALIQGLGWTITWS